MKVLFKASVIIWSGKCCFFGKKSSLKNLSGKSTADTVRNVNKLENLEKTGLFLKPGLRAFALCEPKNHIDKLRACQRPFMSSEATARKTPESLIVIDNSHSDYLTFQLQFHENYFSNRISKKSLRKERCKSPSGSAPPGVSLGTNSTKPLKNTLEKTLCSPLKRKLSLFSCSRHREEVLRQTVVRSSDVQLNPGPVDRGGGSSKKKGKASILVTSYNVRGLNDEKKLRHLVNHCYKQVGGKERDYIACFQETYVSSSGKLPYIWRGNLVVTPGEGNSQGCITLLSSHLSIIESRELAGRAHVLACQRHGDSNVSYIVANIYAPCPNNESKVKFFEWVFDSIGTFEEKYNCRNIVVAGDFNLVFDKTEAKNRAVTAQEERLSKIVKNLCSQFSLRDAAEGKGLFTWNRSGTDTFSAIDKILFSKNQLDLEEIDTNWSLSFSDHAAVEANFNHAKKPNAPKSKIARLDPSILKNPETKALIVHAFNEMNSKAMPDWNPHMKLEYAKMSLRSVVEKIQSEIKRKEKSEEEELNEELDLAVKALSRDNVTAGAAANLIDYIEELRGKKQLLIDAKGRKLAEKLGTKWYNEGEKSTRYFLRILNRSMPDKFSTLTGSNGLVIEGEAEIESEIVDFYKKLYENYEKPEPEHSDNSFFDNISAVEPEVESRIADTITLEELRKTLRSCSDSTPGPDGIPYSYLEALWQTFGPLIIGAWNYSLRTGILPPSHKLSFLKLIPKAGKDLKKLTNWRPITLSNCDHKIITKTYANRMSAGMIDVIKDRQTAYMKGRLINDNIRAIIAAINTSNVEKNLDGLLISLDAKKAFDSVEHSYIEKCLEKFGLGKFIPIFRILYSELKSDVIINGKVVDGYRILRGVKQGDALSCILFIICMEPLLANVEANQEIKPLKSMALNTELPKALAYADDVSVISENKQASLQALFDEYSRLTKLSGLELNADKTELMRLNHINSLENPPKLNFEVDYLGKKYRIESILETKINGILFQQNEEKMRDANVDAVVTKMNSILKKWSMRSLSTLGKILILKTFGISQIIFVMQSIVLGNNHFKKLNACLYKFLWNKHFQAAKAPERIKREIINTPIQLGGFGMLDIVELDNGLKLRALGRLIGSKHPFLEAVKSKIRWGNFFAPKIPENIDSLTYEGIKLLGQDRLALLGKSNLEGNARYVSLLGHTKISAIISNLGKSSLAYFALSNRGAKQLKDLNRRDLELIGPHLPANFLSEARKYIGTQMAIPPGADDATLYYHCSVLKPLEKLSSKEIRTARKEKDPICLYKLGMILAPNEALTWGNSLRKLTSTRHKNILLRTAHGEIYTKEKLFRFNLANDANCVNCEQIETLAHKIYECPYVKRVWQETFRITDRLKADPTEDADITQKILGATLNSSQLLLTIHAEIIMRLLAISGNASYMLLPKTLVSNVLKFLKNKETSPLIKDQLKTLLGD